MQNVCRVSASDHQPAHKSRQRNFSHTNYSSGYLGALQITAKQHYVHNRITSGLRLKVFFSRF